MPVRPVVRQRSEPERHLPARLRTAVWRGRTDESTVVLVRWFGSALAMMILVACGAKTGFATGDNDASVRPAGDCTGTPRPVDILFVTDTSGSMDEELAALAEQVPAFLLSLTRPPDRDGDGRLDWAPIDDLHVAVAPTALEGELATQGDPDRADCGETFPIFQSLGDDVAEVAAATSCLATNTYARSDEDLLSTAARALLPSDDPVWFGSGPNLGDTAHRGFLRAESLLVVLFITDEDDASGCPGGIEGCVAGAQADAYVAVFRTLRPGGELFVGTLAGAPTNATTEAEVLESFEGLRPTSFVCDRGLLRGLPAPRMARFTFGLGGEYRSVCSASYASLTEAVADRVGARACGP